MDMNRMGNRRVLALALMAVTAASAAAQQTSVIREIVVRGNRRVQNEVILNAMRTKVGQPYIQANLESDKLAIQDLGFFQNVDVRAIPQTAGDYQVTVDVSEYPEIKEFQIVGNSSLKTEDLQKALTVQPGQVFNLNAATQSTRAIEDLYVKKGYFARVVGFAPSTESPGTIVVTIQELRIGTIGVQGNRQTKDWVFRRLIRSKSGEAFNGDKWGKDLRRIANTGWFEPGSIKSVENTENEEGKVDLTVELKETRTGNFTVGLQLDPQSSLAGVIRLSENNLYGTGQSVGVDFLQTTRGGGPSVGFDYSNPFFRRSDTTLSASIYSRVQYRFNNALSSSVPITDDDTYYERRTGATVGFSRLLTDDLSAGISGRFENVKTSGSDSNTNVQNGGFIQQDGDVGSVTFGGTLDRRDLAVDASRGYYLQGTLEPGVSKITRVGGLFSDQDILGTKLFTKGQVEYRRYFTNQPPRGRQDPDAPRRVLAARLRYGGIVGTVPFFEQYFAGGANTVRGYDEDRFWGKQTFVANLEYRYPLQRSFNLILFADYGGAWGGYGSTPDFLQSSQFKLHLGYGPGLSFRTPLGPIRLDYGINEDGKGRIHFLIGNSF
ncbi:POTRA domain-containing protein [soil metagenome]